MPSRDPSTLQIGLTYDLRTDIPDTLKAEFAPDFFAELDSEVTINRIAQAIERKGYNVVRIGNLGQLAQFLSSGQRVDLVFNVCEGLWGRARESQVPALLDGYRIPYTFSDPLTLAIGLDKALTKRMWQAAGLPTPEFWVINNELELADLIKFRRTLPLFVKPLREGSSKGISDDSLVHTMKSLEIQVRKVLNEYDQPALVERFLPGREFTVGMLGTGETARVLGVGEILASRDGGVNGHEQKEPHSEDTTFFTPMPAGELRDTIARLAQLAYCEIGCQDAGRVDIRLDENGKPYLLDINPLSGMHPTSAMPNFAKWAGHSYEDLIVSILGCAIARSLKHAHVEQQYA